MDSKLLMVPTILKMTSLSTQVRKMGVELSMLM